MYTILVWEVPRWLIFLWLFGGLVVGTLCGYIATEKKRSGGAWFVAGFFLGFIGLIALAAIPALTEEELKQRQAYENAEDDDELREWREKMKEKKL
jgi:hypothetical protein